MKNYIKLGKNRWLDTEVKKLMGYDNRCCTAFNKIWVEFEPGFPIDLKEKIDNAKRQK